MPVNARIALPLFLALLVWVLYNVVGHQDQGLVSYFKNSMFPPGVPKALYILVTPIEFVSTFLVRPLSPGRPTLRQHARRPPAAGHLRRHHRRAVRRSSGRVVILPFSFVLLVALTGFELLVAFLQAFIFTILTAVYIGSSMHPEH